APSGVQPTPTPPTDYLADEQTAWPQSPTFFFDRKGEYHILNPSYKDIAMAFYAGNDMFTNFRLTVTTSEIQQGSRIGGDYYGIVFRSSAFQLHYYLFEIDPEEGLYAFWRFDGDKKPQWLQISSGPITAKLGQPNVIAAVVKGDSFAFTVNQNPVGKP